MDNKLALTTVATLAYRESLLDEEGSVSTELIKELLELVKVSEVNIGSGTETDAVTNVKATVLDMCRAADITTYDRADLLARFRINTADDEKWYLALEKGLMANLTGEALNKSINSLRFKVKSIITKQKIGDILRRASGDWNFKNDSIQDHNDYVMKVMGDLEDLTTTSSEADPAVNIDVCFSDDESVKAVTDQIEAMNSGERIWKTGHQKMNIMTQDGFREGEMWGIGALTHMDKTGTLLTLFRQFAQYNQPVVRKPGKKPTLVHVTMEDPVKTNFQYLYKDIMVNKTREFIDPKKIDADEIRKVLTEHFRGSGFSVRIRDVNPTEWTFRSLFNYILSLEADGHDVQVLTIDYLSMMPTTGCRQGPMGSDLQDLFRRVRNFCRSKGILCITPHQLSTEAKNLTRGIVSDETFLPYITNKGYWQDCKGLDRELDGAFYIHICKKDGQAYKAFQRDKHRYPGILDDDDKFFFMPFLGKMPIPDDVGQECIGIKKIGKATSNTSTEFFSF